MFALVLLCLVAGVLPGYFIDALAPVVQGLVNAQMPRQAAFAWFTIVPIGESRSSYNGLLLFILIAVAASLAAYVIHRWASHAVRRSAAWDCGFPDASPATQYTAGSFAQPIRRVFGTTVFRAREEIHLPPPGDPRPARMHVHLHDLLWDALYEPVANFVGVDRRRSQQGAVPNDPRLPDIGVGCVGGASGDTGRMAIVVDALVQLGQLLLVLALAPLLTGYVRKVKARLLRRKGPDLIQPYRDLHKLLRKEVVLADNASWVFRVAPYVIFATTWVAAALVPTFATGLGFSPAADLIAIIALLGSARFVLALAGLDVGTSFGGIGSSREMMIASLAEPALLMIAFTLSLLAGSTQLSSVVTYMQGTGVGLRVSLAMALVALVMVAIAENARIPVDNPATHLELTMVHEAMILEYSGRHLAVIEAAASLKLLLYLSVIGCVFVPWGVAVAGQDLTTYAVSLFLYAIKLAVGGLLLAVFETVTAKMRVFRVSDFLGAALMLGLLAALLLFVSRGV